MLYSSYRLPKKPGNVICVASLSTDKLSIVPVLYFETVSTAQALYMLWLGYVNFLEHRLYIIAPAISMVVTQAICSSCNTGYL